MKIIFAFISFVVTVTLGGIGIEYGNTVALLIGIPCIILTTVLIFWAAEGEKFNLNNQHEN